MNKTVRINHISRVEGHGGVTIAINSGKVESVQMNILEGARFLEPLVVGRRYDEVPEILCRICAICSAVHKITSIQAIEKALDVKVSEQVHLLRDLLIQGGNIESHALHVFCLALPDFFKAPSVLALADDYPNELRMGLGLKKLGNSIQECIGGRAIHGPNAIIGGFGKYPDVDSLKHLKDDLEKGLEQAVTTINLLKTITIPDYLFFPATYAAVKPGNGNFSFFGNEIITSPGDLFPVDDYKELTGETSVPHSNAKHSTYQNRPFMVGSLARIILNGEMLRGKAKDALINSGIPIPTNNVLYNTIAQAVEIVYAIERAIEICEVMISEGVKEDKVPEIKAKAGSGTEAVEAPRGTLYHSYVFDDNGRIVSADVITPTAQNGANIEKDLYSAASSFIHLPEEELKHNCEMIVRAYDPCISCAVHLVDIKHIDNL
jgi:sulfhydrogenase subunit alpha